MKGILIGIVVALGVAMAARWVSVVHTAHETFGNYYAFRGCVRLIEKTDAYGICETAGGGILKIVDIGGKWYRDGDGPGVW